MGQLKDKPVHRQGRSPDATDQPVLEQGQSVIDKQPQPEILSMGIGNNKMNKQNKDATDQSELEQGQSVIDKQPKPKALSMGDKRMNKQFKDATDHPELEQGQSVIDKQPQPEEVPGIIMNSYDHSPKVPRLIQPPPAVELVEFSNLKQFKGCYLPDIGNSTYLTSILQCLFHTEALRIALDSASCDEPTKDKFEEMSLSHLLSVLFQKMRHGIDRKCNDKQLIEVLRKIKSLTWGKVHSYDNQDIVSALENILKITSKEVRQVSEIFPYEVQFSFNCPTRQHTISHQRVLLMPVPLPLYDETFTFEEYLKKCIHTQKINVCNKCGVTVDVSAGNEVQVELLRTPSVLILSTKCFNAQEKHHWIETTFEPFERVKYSAYAFIEYRNKDSFSKKYACVKCGDVWYEDSKPHVDQWQGPRTLVLFFQKLHDTGVISCVKESCTTCSCNISDNGDLPSNHLISDPLQIQSKGDNQAMTSEYPEMKAAHITVSKRASSAVVESDNPWYVKANYFKRVHANICGLYNLGNTCYMNSALQCLVHTKPLREFITEHSTHNLGVVQAFSRLVREMWMLQEHNSCRPDYIKSAVALLDERFKGYSQQDAQELISILINGLHEEFNEITGEKPFVRMKVDESKYNSEEEIAAAWKELTEKRDKSEIINIFYGQIKSTLNCHNCSFSQKSYDPLFPVTLPLPKKHDLTLEDCLGLFTEEKLLSNLKKCKNCGQIASHSRKVDIWELPPILMVYFKRFSFHENGSRKIKKPVKFSFTFPHNEFCPRLNKGIDYQLYAVINHQGSLQFGHYFSFVKCDDQWYECNDNVCWKMSENDVLTSDAYVLFYQRIEQNILHLNRDPPIGVGNSAVTNLLPNEMLPKSQSCQLPQANPTIGTSSRSFSYDRVYFRDIETSGAKVQKVLQSPRKRTSSKSSSSSPKIAKKAQSHMEETDQILLSEKPGSNHGATQKFSPNKQSRVHSNICGLHSDSDTMNSTLQCLVHTKPLREFIINSNISGRGLTIAFFKLIQDMWVSKMETCQPKYMKSALEKRFKMYSQLDAQELICNLINGLHDEFNEICGEKPFVRMKVDESKYSSEEELAAAWKELYEKRDKSGIINIFYGQIKSTLRCHKCSFSQISYDATFPLTLPLPKKQNITLEDCLTLFTKEKKLSNSKTCKRCHEIASHSRKVEIWELPPILMVYLKRFTLNKKGKNGKKEAHVEFSFTFPLEKFCHNAMEGIEYQLYAVINHHGSLERGHYYTFIKCDDQWYKCMDYICNEVDKSEVAESDAYVLFYQQINRGSDKKQNTTTDVMQQTTTQFSQLHLESNVSLESNAEIKPTLTITVETKNSVIQCTNYSTCYLKSALHCLAQTEELREFILNSNVEGKYLATALSQFIREVWISEQKFCDPNLTELAIERNFKEYLQQDAQELISILVSDLQEEFNEITGDKPYTALEVNESECNSEEELASEWKKLYEKKHKSKLTRLFNGQIKFVLKCLQCNQRITSFKPLFPLILPSVTMSMEESLDFIMKESSDTRYCKACDKLMPFSKKMDMWELPSILVIYFDSESSSKEAHSVKLKSTFPLAHCCLREKAGVQYQLYAVIVQDSKMGHCFSYVKCDDKWYEYADTGRRRVRENDIYILNAYVVFYQRIELSENEEQKQSIKMMRLKSLSIDLQRIETASNFLQMKRTSSQPLLGSNKTMPVASSDHGEKSTAQFIHSTKSSRLHPNICGLQTLKNCSYMSAALQCLIHTEPLRMFILRNKILDRKISNAFSKLINDMWLSELMTCQLHFMISAMKEIDPRFSGYSQQDAQEFIVLLINKLHEEFNEVTERKPQIRAKLDKSKYKSKEEIKDKSEIINIFHGKIKSTLKCHNCSFSQDTYDPLFPLMLPLPKKHDLTLEDCLKLFTEEKPLSNSKKCKMCDQVTSHFRKVEIWELPPILMVSFERFSFREDHCRKISTPAKISNKFPYKGVCRKFEKSAEYQLYAVINHQGSIESGHYYSFVKCAQQWYKCIGHECSSISESAVIDTTDAYVLFYQQIGVQDSADHSIHITETMLPKSRSFDLPHMEISPRSRANSCDRLYSDNSKIAALECQKVSQTQRKRTNPKASSSSKIVKKTQTQLTDMGEVLVNISSASDCTNAKKFSPKPQPAFKSRVHPNICGLQNDGDVSYMNSALQCLVHTKPLREFISSNSADKNLSTAFSILIEEMWKSEMETCSPNYIKFTLEQVYQRLNEVLQQDAQEFISVLINGLHDEIHSVRKIYVVDESSFSSGEEMAAASKGLTERRQKSEIIDIFYGQTKSTIKCCNCSFICETYDQFFPLPLPLPKKQNLTLEDCLKLFMEEQLLPEAENCEICQWITHHYKKVEIWELPPVVVIHLKRLSEMGTKKIKTPVKFSFTLPLENFFQRERKGIQYQLYAVLNHEGSAKDGKYYSFVKCEEKWYECNDARCKEIHEDDIVTSFAYVLFYERCERK